MREAWDFMIESQLSLKWKYITFYTGLLEGLKDLTYVKLSSLGNSLCEAQLSVDPCLLPEWAAICVSCSLSLIIWTSSSICLPSFPNYVLRHPRMLQQTHQEHIKIFKFLKGNSETWHLLDMEWTTGSKEFTFSAFNCDTLLSLMSYFCRAVFLWLQW